MAGFAYLLVGIIDFLGVLITDVVVLGGTNWLLVGLFGR